MFSSVYLSHFREFLLDTASFDMYNILTDVEYSTSLPIDTYFNFIENDIICFFTNVEYDNYFFLIKMQY